MRAISSEVTQVNLRHAVSPAQRRQQAAYSGSSKVREFNAYREPHGAKVTGLPARWKWRENQEAHPALHRLLTMATNNTRRVTRSILPHLHTDAVERLRATRKRLALVITCSTFDEPPSVIQRLPNAKRDGDLLHGTLKRLGWEVCLCIYAQTHSRSKHVSTQPKCEAFDMTAREVSEMCAWRLPRTLAGGVTSCA